MLPINTKLYKFDTFNFEYRAIAEYLAPLDFTYATACTSLFVEGTEPQNTSRRVIFKIDGNYYKFGTNGLVKYTRRLDIPDILAFGNSVDEIIARKDFSDFVGKRVYPIVALQAPCDCPIMPRFKITAKVKTFNDVYMKTTYSPEYTINETAKILDITFDKELRGNANAKISVRLKNPKTGWSDFMDTGDAIFKPACAFQFKIDYVLSAIDGSDAATFHDVNFKFTTDPSLFTGKITEYFTNTVGFENTLNTCHALISHFPFGGNVRAYASFGEMSINRENVKLGFGTGDLQTLYLVHDNKIDSAVAQDSILVHTDNNSPFDLEGKLVYDVDYDSASSSITGKFPRGSTIYADWRTIGAESWSEMDLVSGDETTSRFEISGRGNSSAVKFTIEGYTSPELLEVAAGWKA